MSEPTLNCTYSSNGVNVYFQNSDKTVNISHV